MAPYPKYGSIEDSGTLFRTLSNPSLIEKPPPMRKNKQRCEIPKRYVFSLLCFIACCLAVSYNMSLSIAIEPMINNTSSLNAVRELLPLFQGDENVPASLIYNASPTVWNADMKGVALGAVYFGQLVSFIPGGRMAELYGGKRMLIVCTMLAAVTSMLLPVLVMLHPYAFVAGRAIIGLGTGPVIPIVFFMLGRWIPMNERSFHASFILSGYGIGSFLGVMISGFLCGSEFLGGWPSVYYTGGFFGILWCLICHFIMCETPDVHSTINEEEFSYITEGLEAQKKQQISKIPWLEMSLSIPLWALAVGFFGQFWLLGFFSTVHAVYMGLVLEIPVVENGMLSCLPHLLRAFATCLASYPVDIALKRRLVSIAFVRKGATVINSVVSCAAFVGITLVGRNVCATTLLFIVGGILGEFVTFGVCMACIDIAPNLSGTVSGIINIIGVLPFFLIPALVGEMTNYENSIQQWHNVMYVTVALVSVSTLIFVAFGDMKPQSWGTCSSSNTVDKKQRIPRPPTNGIHFNQQT